MWTMVHFKIGIAIKGLWVDHGAPSLGSGIPHTDFELHRGGKALSRTLGRTATTRLSDKTYVALTARARLAGVSLSSYLHGLVEKDVQEVDHYMLQTAARSSQATLNIVVHLLGFLAKDPEQARMLTANISRQMDASFGRQKSVPAVVAREQSASTDGFIADILAVYERHANLKTK